MKIALISDIHSNLEAFSEVLRDIKRRGITRIICLGDIVGYGANPNECVDLIKKMKIKSVQGNHEFYCQDLGQLEEFNPYAAEALSWTHHALTKENLAFLAKLPKTMEIEGIFFAHGSPRDPTDEYVYDDVSIDEARLFFDKAKTEIIALGHTHIPFIKRFGDKMIFNPGSVGQPRDGNPKASYCIFDTKTKTVEMQRVEYNIKKAADKIMEAGLPLILSSRLYRGR